MTMEAIGRALMFVSSWLRSMIVSALGIGRRMLSPVAFPLRYQRKKVMQRVIAIVSDRLLVIEEDRFELLDGEGQKPEYAEARNRARVREVNAILSALDREFFPLVDVGELVAPRELQDLVHGAVNNAKNGAANRTSEARFCPKTIV